MAEVRIAEFRSKMDLLRQLDPANPNLSYISKPDYVPSQADLDSLNAAIQAAAIKRVTDFVMPGGQAIGAPGGGVEVREVSGGPEAAKAAFDYLRLGGTVVSIPSYPGTLVKLRGNAGYVGLRPLSTSGPPGLDLNISGMPYKTLYYLER